MGAHALLSPSGASRWIACPPSARLEEQFPSSTNSAAEEGTLAHELSEWYLRNHLKLVPKVVFDRNLKRIKANAMYNSEMDGHCMDYVNFIVDKIHPDSIIFIEEQMDLTAFVPEGFGTVDCVIVHEGHLCINDLKYGKGVEVTAHENKQLMLYALGAYHKYSLMYTIENIEMNIFQPRLNNYSNYEIPVEELLAWGEQIVKPAAQMAWDGQGEYTAGKHCQWCKAKTTCKALADYNMELAKYAFEDPNKLSDDDIADILEKAADFKTWLTAVQTYALSEAIVHQKKWPRFKLVAGKSNRVYANPDAIVRALQKAKINKDLYLTEPKLVGIGALEKNIGKAKVTELAGQFIIKPAGAVTLVPAWDKRDEINSTDAAVAAFEDIQTTNE